MGLWGMWRRLWTHQPCADFTKPILINPRTGERIAFTDSMEPPNGKWVLRRPLTLPESTSPLFIISLLNRDRSRR